MDTIRRSDPLVTIAISTWVLTMVAIPILCWIFGDATLVSMATAGVVMQSLAVWIILWRGNGIRFALWSILLILLLAWMVEFIGSTTGIPFGRYSYTNALQPQLGGVPLVIPLAWMMMLPPAWTIALLVINSRTISPPLPVRLARAGVAAIAFTAWDLSLDPQMVSWCFWRWSSPGAFFGIPLVNYLGWLVVSFMFSFFLLPTRLPNRQLLIIYAFTWFLQSFGLAFFWKLPGPAVCGFIGMGGILYWVYARRNRWKQHI
jgi:uncharacterized membrane protein